MLATMSDDVLEKYFYCRQYEQYTPFTITDTAQLRRQLREVAVRGYAIARDEMNLGMSSVGTVIRDYTLKTVGAVSLIGPSQRLRDTRLTEQLVPLLLGVAAGISGKLGYC